jgi:sugar phosphate permease
LLIRGQPGLAIWLDAATFLLSAGALALLPRLNPVPEGSDAEGTGRMTSQWRRDLRMVRDFLRGHRVVLGVMAGFFAIVVFGSAADAQEVVFARRALGLSQSGYGYLVSAAGSGYVAGALLSYFVGPKLSVRVALGTGVVLSAASYLFYARSTTFGTAALALVLLGIFQAIANVGFGVYLQESLPTTVIGRIMGTVQAGRNGLTVLAILVGGILAHTAGVRWMMTGAALAALAAGLWLTGLCLGSGAAARFASSDVRRQASM